MGNFTVSRKIEKMDKGKRLFVIEQRVIDLLPKVFKYAIMYFLLVICIIVDAITSNIHQLILVVLLLVIYSVIFIAPRRCEIYEGGVRYGKIFVKWEDVKKVKWEDSNNKS